MPSKYVMTSNVCYDKNMYKNIMTSHVRHSERGYVISDCLVVVIVVVVIIVVIVVDNVHV